MARMTVLLILCFEIFLYYFYMRNTNINMINKLLIAVIHLDLFFKIFFIILSVPIILSLILLKLKCPSLIFGIVKLFFGELLIIHVSSTTIFLITALFLNSISLFPQLSFIFSISLILWFSKITNLGFLIFISREYILIILLIKLSS